MVCHVGSITASSAQCEEKWKRGKEQRTAQKTRWQETAKDMFENMQLERIMFVMSNCSRLVNQLSVLLPLSPFRNYENSVSKYENSIIYSRQLLSE